MLDHLFEFFSSLRLTVACLVMGMILVFVGTLAQVHEGLFLAQANFFESVFVMWHPHGASWGIPIFPGGYLLGAVLLVNLLAAHFKRFKWSKKKIGIFLIHGGLILLLLGQLVTELFKQESSMLLKEGQPKNYSESQRDCELVVEDTSSAQYNKVYSIPGSRLKTGRLIRDKHLPFAIQVDHYYPNARVSQTNVVVHASLAGLGRRLVVEQVPPTYRLDERNLPAAEIRIGDNKQALGTWLVSSELEGLQPFRWKGKTYKIGLRFKRFYAPYSLELEKFHHDVYRGTDIAKNFSSNVRIYRPDTGEDREVRIYMNHPLRYDGATYYQASYDPNNPDVTILQVVRNPAWLTPYVACSLVGLGLLLQFLSHLIQFSKRRRR